MRILGIDYGRRRLGLAISDEGEILATPLPVYERRGEKEDLTFLSNLASERKAGRIILGLPLNMEFSCRRTCRANAARGCVTVSPLSSSCRGTSKVGEKLRNKKVPESGNLLEVRQRGSRASMGW